MSFWKEVLQKHFWIGILMLFVVVVAVNAAGALVLCKGWMPMSYAHTWMLSGWLLGGFVGARFALCAEREQRLLRALLACLMGYVLAWGIGLGFSQGKCCPDSWWQVALVLLAASLAAAWMGPGKKRRAGKRPKRGAGKTR